MRKFRQFVHKLGLYCIFFIAHARNGRISTSGLKFDVTTVFLDPDFRENLGDSRTCNSCVYAADLKIGYADNSVRWRTSWGACGIGL